MTQQTTRLELPYILPSQAQKHVTHNEALQRLDAITQLVIHSEIGAPPGTPQEGDCFLIAAAATGEWSGKTGKLAFRQDDAWIYLSPREGWQAWFVESGRARALQNGSWREIPLPESASFQQLGVNATADAANRLAVSSAASLFTNASSGGGHQVKVNKATSADTASLLFQSGWSGRAEMGLAGNDSFSIKTTADGATWTTALSISGAGQVSMPARPLVRAGRAAGNISHAAGSVSGFTDLPVQQGGFALGNVVTDTLKELRVPATGIYVMTVSLAVVSSSGHTVTIRINGTSSSFALNGTTSAANSLQSASFIVPLTANDRISLAHGGTCQLAYGARKSEISLIML
ncbi:hypothetical protein DSM25558_1881 [Agrobacterium sp. DSM 25558]|uniref:DUF2793 domain-containing protein n=1 Tax=Agrobacterium sp. DSM 25558 TaxID=1907665 RepID=UPI0009724D61|nr:DUF2793 domain-containing protein [Agrobacterium sp. DSM 25558]SCX14576.1 hypothetical protein DSM25558_1881 [Agrobacterium sp. DSM 25558]